MNPNEQWKPVAPEMKFGKYKVLFDGGTEGVASLTPRGWIIVEDSIHRPKEANIVAWKHHNDHEPRFSKTQTPSGKAIL